MLRLLQTLIKQSVAKRNMTGHPTVTCDYHPKLYQELEHVAGDVEVRGTMRTYFGATETGSEWRIAMRMPPAQKGRW